MVIEFNCDCGNTDPKKTYSYDGALGYEATVCTSCGRYYDIYGDHKPDKFSKQFTVKCN